MKLRQSDLKTWQECALRWRFANVDRLPGEQSCALTFGTVIHDAVLTLETTRDLDAALAQFTTQWTQPEAVDPGLAIDYWLPGRNWKKYADEGEKALRAWWAIVQWDADVTLAREHHFEVPICDGRHVLEGTVDKLSLRYLAKTDEYVVLTTDFKTSVKLPSYGYLEEDLQFTAYSYANTRPEFWTGIPNGAHLFDQARGLRRMGEWVHLRGPQRKSAGERTQRHYNRLAYAVDQVATSIAMGIYPPTISGETCKFCPYRLPCGLPEVMEQAA